MPVATQLSPARPYLLEFQPSTTQHHQLGTKHSAYMGDTVYPDYDNAPWVIPGLIALCEESVVKVIETIVNVGSRGFLQ